MLDEIELPASCVTADDFRDVAALRALSRELDVPYLYEYWKSVPYFLNFGTGYRLGTELKEVLQEGADADVTRLVASARSIGRVEMEQHQPLAPGNARYEALARDIARTGAWQLLWMPPSLPYTQFAGPYAHPENQQLTKHLVFSSWTATPTAIAALVSHDAQRHVLAAHDAGGPPQRGRLEFRMDGNRPGGMSTLALFWPNPSLAELTDPLTFASDSSKGTLTIEELTSRAATALEPAIGADGTTTASASESWYWLAPFRLPDAVPDATEDDLANALRGVVDPNDEEHARDAQRIVAHVLVAQAARSEPAPTARPNDLRATVAEIGLHGPGNVAWRALGRQLGREHGVTPVGHWRAAATIASGFRSLFNRPDVMALLDLIGASALAYWRAVLAYCAAGNLQAVVDEYLHHVVGDRGSAPLKDSDLLDVATTVRDAIAMRPARYTAFDPDRPGDPLVFQSRFALRYGNRDQTEGDVRQPAVRSAFNSPFWPFVLATTSIGQEGVDFHWWCHRVVHWNTPANPVDFDQREGRVNRYGGHAIRKNVATRHRTAMLSPGVLDPWAAGYAAATEYRNQLGDLSPHWIYPGAARIERVVLPYPLSVDASRLQRLKDDVAMYRLVFGQPRQEDLLDLLRRQGVQADAAYMAKMRIDLTPPSLAPGDRFTSVGMDVARLRQSCTSTSP